MSLNRRSFLSLQALALPGLAATASAGSHDPVHGALVQWAANNPGVSVQTPMLPGCDYGVTVVNPQQLGDTLPSLVETFGGAQARGNRFTMAHGGRTFGLRVRVA